MSTTLPLDFPGLQTEARRLMVELYNAAPEGFIVNRNPEERMVKAAAKLLADLTRPESQCFWRQALAVRLGKPVHPCSPPRLGRDAFNSTQVGRELYWFTTTGPDAWMMGFHDNPNAIEYSEWDLRVPGINGAPTTPDGAIVVLRLALCAAFGVAP